MSSSSSSSSSSLSRNTYIVCNNCGKPGHIYSKCKIPITSHGIIAARKSSAGSSWQFLIICRKDSLGFMDFVRGKYLLDNEAYIKNMILQMTNHERHLLMSGDFVQIRQEAWGTAPMNEETVSREKYTTLFERGVIQTLVEQCNQEVQWTDPEWGFPKGRKNTHEKDLDCALREFEEETGISNRTLQLLQNVVPYEEVFVGSNYKSYKHKYFVAIAATAAATAVAAAPPGFSANFEVSKIMWGSLAECLQKIRGYNTNKIQMLQHVHQLLCHMSLIQYPLQPLPLTSLPPLSSSSPSLRYHQRRQHRPSHHHHHHHH